MSTLNSASTDVQVWAAYDDNASYEEDGSVAKCKSFITACTILIRRTPKRAGTRESDMETSIEEVRKALERAREWLAANDTAADSAGGGSVKRMSFRSFR